MKLLLLLLTLAACAADPQDMSGKMFTFPETNQISYIRMTTDMYKLSAATVCLRSFTDLQRSHVLFSLATPDLDKGFRIFWDGERKAMDVHTLDLPAEYEGTRYKPNTWHAICATWHSETGLVQLWMDGNPTGRKLTTGNSLRGPLIILVGQDQDPKSKRFDAEKSFVGMQTDINMWNYVLSSCEIHNYVDALSFTPGNVLNWKALDYLLFNRIVVEDLVTTCAASSNQRQI